jgi:hypothetical protein
VAAGAEQMGASIREIASNAAEASEVAARAVSAAATTTCGRVARSPKRAPVRADSRM